jgi:AcrR family transcriptional regulator
MLTRQRARTPDQKNMRAQAVLDAAWALFQDQDFDAITVARIAERAGLAKGTVFLYFASKEALFLEALRRELAAWLLEFNAWLELAAPSQDARLMAGQFAASLHARPSMLRLLAMLHSQLEPNAGLDAVIAFKLFLSDALTIGGAQVERHLMLPAGSGYGILLDLYALAIGIQHQAPTPIAEAAFKADPSLILRARGFETTLARAASALLVGSIASLRDANA